MRVIPIVCLIASISTAMAEENYWQKVIRPPEALSDKLPEITLEGPKDNLVEEIPDHILKTNDRFFTISIENDLFGSGVDRDYTNGLRFGYANVGQEQPAFLHWLDRALPMFTINKTTTSYYSLGHNLYTPHTIKESGYIKNDRPYAAFLYGSVGMNTITENHMDDVELTLGIVGPSAKGKQIQREFHKLKGVDKPKGWAHQIHDEPGVMLSWERSYPGYYGAKIGNSIYTRVNPHYGVTVGNVYTYASAGISLDITPRNMPWQAQPVRVRPALPGSGFFETPDSGHSWMIFGGLDTRWVLRNIFLDGNTFKDSHSVKKKPFVLDAAIGAAYTYHQMRFTYTMNWRSKEFDSEHSRSAIFGSISLNYRF
ncbi:lipid A deacylase LpxR family protein [Suttonella ornithocola]|uniref:Uncharacterized protein conserved in bacteria n=1 Tax=Suttonella ornithocola TaxID=279832 RepID=A0A380MXK7_9GAMM|nr:lipid A deacylase LpxR family protein [Suttonella ornithocola]SUO97305.1 Uncharacterized protein conserved in bacteria [Suttonella ornithocola]